MLLWHLLLDSLDNLHPKKIKEKLRMIHPNTGSSKESQLRAQSSSQHEVTTGLP